ncbi:MAG: glycoside hydrolase family 26 protein [Bacteroidales bacterium]|jgi:mannan endo-1,4-beta-mannosidase|nr:glycoside hydrolase family 26 protein [Bacteroidales bacterium]
MKNGYKKILKALYIITAIPFIFSCSGKEDRPNPNPNGGDGSGTTLSIVNKNATNETKNLLANLWAIQEKGTMFGHQADLMYGRTWINEDGRSDTKDVCGDYPAVFAFDIARVMDGYSLDYDQITAGVLKKCMVEAYDRGMVLMACAHLHNPLTGGTAWDDSSNEVAKEILTEGSATQIKFEGWLDNLADFMKELKGSDGKLIPVIFRPFHEHTQSYSWSWWGYTCTTEAEFIGLWRFTVNYLIKTKSVNNLLFAISPQDSDILCRWPGDDYVDFIGADCYQGTDITAFVSHLKTLQSISQEKKKPCGVTETGIQGFRISDYWTRYILAPLTGRKISMIITWRNAYDPLQHGDEYFSVYKGHISQADFVKYYNSDISYFCNDLPNMYAPISEIAVE